MGIFRYLRCVVGLRSTIQDCLCLNSRDKKSKASHGIHHGYGEELKAEEDLNVIVERNGRCWC